MAVSLMGTFGDSAGGSFWDDEPDGGDTTGQANDYIKVTTNSNRDISASDDEKIQNPFDTFGDEEDPDEYLDSYNRLKADIRQIEQNARAIKKLSERYNSSTGKDENTAIMKELDDIMSQNSRITGKIKNQLKSEKVKNDDYQINHKSSSVGQWRVNQLNTCTRRFKSASLEFSQELNSFNATLRDKQKRHIDILDSNNLTEKEKEDMVNDYDRAEAFIQEQFQMVDTADALVDRLAELEDRHQGMLKIEKSIKELQELWMELNVLVTEQQELLDHITKNVEETRDYVKSATKHLQKAEKKQKCTRKLQLYACCCCLIILVLVIVMVFGTGAVGGS